MRHVLETYLNFREILKNSDLIYLNDYIFDISELDDDIEINTKEYENINEFEIKLTLAYFGNDIRFVFKKDGVYLKYMNQFNKCFLYEDIEKCKGVLNFILKNHTKVKVAYHSLVDERMKFNYRIEKFAKGEK